MSFGYKLAPAFIASEAIRHCERMRSNPAITRDISHAIPGLLRMRSQ
jgi:hypothetical protein